ncbi:MAG: uncharacterized membrane protein YsdA (DUF1294 family) [Rhodothermales bacterium]|jgi:uncharacterized membrane protein YsdA (DUF1294 family)
MTVFLGIVALWSVVAFLAFGWDKRQARMNRRRISERALLLFTLSGGVMGSIAGIFFFRHKTRKTAFLIRFVPTAIVGIVILAMISREILSSP